MDELARDSRPIEPATRAEAHASLATFKLFYEYDWAGCEREFRRAFALNPNYAFAHDQFDLALAFQGRLDEAIAEGRRAASILPHVSPAGDRRLPLLAHNMV